MSTATEVPATKKFKFRLIHGRHIEGRGEDKKVYQVVRDPITKLNTCPIIETDKNLHILFDQEGIPARFERVHGEPTPVLLNPLERMAGESVQAYLTRLDELTQGIKAKLALEGKRIDAFNKEDCEEYAEAEEIDLKTAKTAEQMRAILKNALKG